MKHTSTQRRKELLNTFAEHIEAGRVPSVHMAATTTESELLWLGRLLGYMARSWAHDIEVNERLLGMGAMPGAPGNDADGWWAAEVMNEAEREAERKPYVLDTDAQVYLEELLGKPTVLVKLPANVPGELPESEGGDPT